jgi:hypothetical protein
MENQFETLKQDLDSNSKRIGETVRYVCFGIIGVTFLIFTSKDLSTFFQTQNNKVALIIPSSLCIVSLLFDYFQAFIGFLDNSINLNKLKINQTINEKSYLRLLRYLFFYLKQVFVIIGSLLFIKIMIIIIFN